MVKYNLEVKGKVFVNRDPQRRCYNGAWADAVYVDGDWVVMEYDVPVDKHEERLEFWRDLNDYAVSQRGDNAAKQYRIVGV